MPSEVQFLILFSKMAQPWRIVLTFLSACICFTNHVNAEIWKVATASEFQAALRGVAPGDVVQLAPVEFYGFFAAEIDGTPQDKITIQGSKDSSIISSWSTGFNLEASFYVLEDFTVANSAKGIMVTGGSGNLLQNLIIRDINEEGIHLRSFSSDNTIQHCTVFNTGITRPGFGEGIYIGSDYSKWTSPDSPDQSDRNIIRYNQIGPNCAGEGIDLKEGSCCGLVEWNYFDGRGMSNVNSDDSWVDVKGSDYTFQHNVGDWTLKDGWQVRSHMPNGGVSGCRNVFRNNTSNLHSGGYAVYLNSRTQCDNSTVIYSDNTVLNGGELTNGWVTPLETSASF